MTVLTGAPATSQVRTISPLGKNESHPFEGGSHRMWERETKWS
jgi:hypothetical protein